MLRAMQNEAGRQIVRSLTVDDYGLPPELRGLERGKTTHAV